MFQKINALGLLINNRSNFREERIIVRKIAVTFREEWIIAWKFGMNHRAKRIIMRNITRIKTIGVMKMQGNFVETSFQATFLQKATKSQEFRWNSFALLLHNTVTSSFSFTEERFSEHHLKKARYTISCHKVVVTWCSRTQRPWILNERFSQSKRSLCSPRAFFWNRKVS